MCWKLKTNSRINCICQIRNYGQPTVLWRSTVRPIHRLLLPRQYSGPHHQLTWSSRSSALITIHIISSYTSKQDMDMDMDRWAGWWMVDVGLCLWILTGNLLGPPLPQGVAILSLFYARIVCLFLEFWARSIIGSSSKRMTWLSVSTIRLRIVFYLVCSSIEHRVKM